MHDCEHDKMEHLFEDINVVVLQKSESVGWCFNTHLKFNVCMAETI